MNSTFQDYIQKKIVGSEKFAGVFSDVLKIIKSSRKAAIVSHENPDADAIGSTLALAELVRSSGVETISVLADEIPFNLKFLPGADKVLIFDDEVLEKIKKSDLLIVVDCNEPLRLGSAKKILDSFPGTIVVIDHHAKKSDYADAEIIDEAASSAGEIVWRLLKFSEFSDCSKDLAVNLYAAIMTDTGNFRFERTSALTHVAAADLVFAGAVPNDIYDEIFNRYGSERLKLTGRALASLELRADGKISSMVLTKKDFEETGASVDDADNFSQFTMSIDGVEAGFFLAELPGTDSIKASFRSKGNLEIRKVAELFGGGGHFRAAGARIEGIDIFDLREAVNSDIEKRLS